MTTATIPGFFTNPARACAQPGVNADWFFVETSVPVAALAVCCNCPVRNECLQHALTKPETYGVWGGLSARQRNRIRRGR